MEKKIKVEILAYVSVMDIVSAKTTNAMAANVTKNCQGKKERYKFDCYILHTVLLMIISLLIMTIISYYYAKQKRVNALTK